MLFLYMGTGLALLISFFANRGKTFEALKIAFKKFSKIVPAFLSMLIVISVVLFLIPDNSISGYLGNSNIFFSVILASLLGSITLIPGPIAYPLCGILIKEGVMYMVVSAFSTTLMMVGVLTYPLEKEYFGSKVTVIRNILSFFIALAVALVTGFFFRELL